MAAAGRPLIRVRTPSTVAEITEFWTENTEEASARLKQIHAVFTKNHWQPVESSITNLRATTAADLTAPISYGTDQEGKKYFAFRVVTKIDAQTEMDTKIAAEREPHAVFFVQCAKHAAQWREVSCLREVIFPTNGFSLSTNIRTMDQLMKGTHTRYQLML